MLSVMMWSVARANGYALALLVATAGATLAQNSDGLPSCGRGKTGEARLKACQADARFNSGNVRAHLAYAWALIDAGRFDDALAEFETSAKIDPPNPEAHYGKGVALAQLGQQGDAVGSFRNALRFGGTAQAPVQLALARSLNLLGRYADAMAAADAAIALAPQEAAGHYSRAYALTKLARDDEALLSLGEAARLAPDDAGLLVELGAAPQRQQRTEEAYRAFEAATRLAPSDTSAWGALGLTAAQLQRFDDAVRAWGRARSLDSTYFATRPDERDLFERSVSMMQKP